MYRTVYTMSSRLSDVKRTLILVLVVLVIIRTTCAFRLVLKFPSLVLRMQAVPYRIGLYVLGRIFQAITHYYLPTSLPTIM